MVHYILFLKDNSSIRKFYSFSSLSINNANMIHYTWFLKDNLSYTHSANWEVGVVYFNVPLPYS